ncbi:GNAT family N-acetyltransferase [Actinokineospora inagensis]|uniref:GNAT family N-acetyltransferase n=1 Tax=Actinokineospora inagensis TaxID=103730 RepID=UPI0003F9BAD8|nr:GNAT family N-acetyltransferase [Actinokineospora inagensis]
MTAPPLVLRRLGEPDVPALLQTLAAQVDHLRPWLAWAADDPTEDSVRAHVADTEADWERGTAFGYGITLAGEIIGRCALHARIGAGGLEIGYWVRREHQGRGLMTLATGTVVAAAFAVPGIDRVEIVHDTANVRSGAIPRRLGFVEVSRTPVPRTSPARDAVDVRWRLTRAAFLARAEQPPFPA